MIGSIRYHAGQAVWRVLFPMLQRRPGLRQRFWRSFYNRGAAEIADDSCTFLNWGYLGEDEGALSPTLVEAPDLLEQLSARLYDYVLEGIDVSGRHVLEVGSGRGGGSAYIAATRRPASAVGVDASDRLVAWCSAHYDIADLRFQHGFASELPVAAETVDVVVCVESSHCYPSRLEFVREAARVLKPGGKVALADMLWPNPEADTGMAVADLIERAGLQLERSEPITAAVLSSRRALSRSRAFRRRLPQLAGGLLEARSVADAWALEGTKPFRAMANGELEYWCWTARKPAAAPTP